MLDDFAPFFNYQHLIQTLGKTTNTLRLQRPRHAHLVQTQTQISSLVGMDAEFGQRLSHILKCLACGHNAKTRMRCIEHGKVNIVGTCKRERRVPLVLLQSLVLHQWRVRPAQIETAFRKLNIVWHHKATQLVTQGHNGAGLDGIGDHLVANPTTGVTRHRDPEQTQLDELVN